MKLQIRPFAAAVCLALGISANAATTLTVTSFPNLDQAIKAAIPIWQKAHPDIEIKLVSLEYGDHHNAMTTALATGSNLPDVMSVEFGFVGRFAEGGGLEDLSKPPYSATQYKSKFVKYTFPQATSPTGVLGAMPTDIGPGTMFYRKDIIEKAGLTEADLTKSWDSYIESGKKIKSTTGAYLLAHARDIKDIYIRSGLKDNDGLFFDSNKKVVVDSPRFVKAFELAKQVRDAGIDAKIGAWSNEWGEAFKRGAVTTQMMGAWLGGHLASWLAPDTKGLWRAASLPNNAYASWGGSFYAIPKKAAHKKEAWEFIKFMTLQKDMQINSFKALDAFPALLDAQSDPFFEQPVEFLGGQQARVLWRDAAKRIPVIAVNKYDRVADEIINSELDKVLDQGKDIKTALADAKQQIERRARR